MGGRIVIMAGGTGGHVFPALAVAQYLRDKNWIVSWMGTRQGMESRVVPKNNIEIDWLSIAGLRGKGLIAKAKAPLMLIIACAQALQILRSRRPDVVLGMGGFVAGPGGLMARLLSIPLVIHEQNRIPGTTNKLLQRVANTVLEAFPGSFSKPGIATWTGNPLRREFIQPVNAIAPPGSSTIHLLVVGGSQGAKALNELVPEAIAKMDDIEVLHQTGKTMLDAVTKHYQRSESTAEVVDFIDDMFAAYQWADMVICRSGAMTVSELSATGLPAILIPFPFAIDDHQTANARYLTDAGAGVLIEQKNLTVETLITQIKQVSENLPTMAKVAKACAKLDATAVVAEVCIAEGGQ